MMNAPPPKDPLRRIALVACGALVMAFGILSYSAALTKSATYDEPFHALSGWVHWHEGDFRIDYENPPLAFYPAGFLNGKTALKLNFDDPNWTNLPSNPYLAWNWATQSLYRTPGNDGIGFIQRSRLAMVAMGMALAGLIAAWSWKWAGPIAAILSTALFVFDPNFLGHSPLVKNDVPIALFVAGTCAMAWRVGVAATGLNVAGLGLLLAGALCTKHSGVLLIPILGILMLIRIALPLPWPVLGKEAVKPGSRAIRAIAIAAIVGLIAWAGLWACYGFRFAPTRNPDIALNTAMHRLEIRYWTFRSLDSGVAIEPISADALARSLQSTRAALDSAPALKEAIPLRYLLDQAESQHRAATEAAAGGADHGAVSLALAEADRQVAFVDQVLGDPTGDRTLPVRVVDALLDYRLVPAAWSNGLLLQYARSRIRPAFLLNEVSVTGWGYYFPLAVLFKTPLATLAALLWAMGIGLLALRREWPFRTASIWAMACIAIGLIVLGIASLVSSLNIGIRHLLPIYPLVYVAAGVALSGAANHLRERRVLIMLGVLLAAESLWAWPNYIAYLNIAAGGPRGGIGLLGDSNLDWGQDLSTLARWREAHPNRLLALAYFGKVDPSAYGIEYIPVPPWPPSPELLRTHVIAISATHLQGIFDPQFAGYRNLPPREVLGGTIYLYYDGPAGGN